MKPLECVDKIKAGNLTELDKVVCLINIIDNSTDNELYKEPYKTVLKSHKKYLMAVSDCSVHDPLETAKGALNQLGIKFDAVVYDKSKKNLRRNLLLLLS